MNISLALENNDSAFRALGQGLEVDSLEFRESLA
jgi:hypothetical protein